MAELAVPMFINTPPLVSVLTTVFNREKYIRDSIDSVLSSTYSSIELIVVDDFSTDHSFEIAREYEKQDDRVKVYRNNKNLGDYPNRNKAASYATGKYLKFLDSDDVLYPHGLQVMVEAMERFPEAGFGLAALPDKKGPYPRLISPAEIYREHFHGFRHFERSPGSAIIKRDAFEKVGGFTGERMIGDLQLWIELAKTNSMVKFPFHLYWYRIHEDQEFQTDYAKRIYPKRTREIIENALKDNDCPLSPDEVEQIRKQMRRNDRKGRLKKFGRMLAAPFID